MFTDISSYLVSRLAEGTNDLESKSSGVEHHPQFKQFIELGVYKQPDLPRSFQSIGVYDIGVNVNLSFDLLIYAPPHSGKSTFIMAELPDRLWFDTDYLHYWTSTCVTYCVTNMANLIRHARRSIAFVPSKGVFVSRCEKRGLIVGESWYDGLVRDAQHATMVVSTDEYISEVVDKSVELRGFIQAMLPTC